MLTATHTVTVNAAFLQEIKDEDEQLRTLLEQTRQVCKSLSYLDIPASRFASLLTELRDQLAMHFALEEAYGYFDDPVSVAPHLSERADALRNQHDELYEEIATLAESAQDTSHRNGDPRQQNWQCVRSSDEHPDFIRRRMSVRVVDVWQR